MDRDPINVLSLCSGAGGLDQGVAMALRGSRSVCYVEIEAYAVEVLAEAMEEGRLDPAPVWSDVRSFDGKPWRGLVDGVVGGYPCQPFSVAGHLLGRKDPRHLWPDIARIIAETEPSFVFFENVSGHVKRGLREVRSDLQRMGYRVAAGLFRAEEVGANHRRERLFILGVSDRERLERRCLRNVIGAHEWLSRAAGGAVADAAMLGHPRDQGIRREARSGAQHDRRDVADADGVRGANADLQAAPVGGRRQGPRTLAPGRGAQPPLADTQYARQRGSGQAHDLDGRDAPGDDAHGRHAELVVVEAVSDGSSQRQGRRLRAPVGWDAEPRHDGAASPFPPAPDDELGWRRLLAIEPRVEPAVRRDVDGLAVESHGGGVSALCLCNRVDRLRICGNGVVPYQAGLAFVTLAEEFD